MPTSMSAVLHLPVDLSSPARARAFLREDTRCSSLGPALVGRVELLVSELVTNAVRHAGEPIWVELTCEPEGGVKVVVGDGSSRSPQLRHASPLEESGRGMEIMDLLSDDWGVELAPDGKSVWFRVKS